MRCGQGRPTMIRMDAAAGEASGNIVPPDVESVHLIAVCGTGMGALACLLKASGLRVTGSDRNIYPPMSHFLAAEGIPIHQGFDPDHLHHRPDLVVVGNAVSRDNPEVVELHRMGLAFCSMPQALNAFVARGKKALLVAGTHGKTTTAAILAWLLQAAGMDISFFIGGILENFQSNHRLGRGNYIVIEGDEYDTAYFDKGPKFLHYQPLLTILTSVEFDHADIFTDFAHVKRTFNTFVQGLRADSTLISCADDPVVRRLSAASPARRESYGNGATALWRLDGIHIEPPWSFFSVLHNGRRLGEFKTLLKGVHNLGNALAAIAAALDLGAPLPALQSALPAFKGVKRRQEIRGVKNGITVFDDFAHHPTAVQKTIQGVRRFVEKGRLIAVFEPRTNTSMRDVFQSVYPSAFADADLILIREPPLLEKIPPQERFSSPRLVADLTAMGKNAIYFENTEAIIDYLTQNAVCGDAVLIMSNGGFDDIHERLLKRL